MARTIAIVHLWQNGMVRAFDSKGQPIPEYEGKYEDVKPVILRDAPSNTIFHKAGFRKPRTIVPREDW